MNRPVLLVCALGISASAQQPSVPSPRFEDYPAVETFRAKPVPPVLRTRDELQFRVVITQGVSKGWGVFDGTTGKEQRRPGPNFAGHYILIYFGCGSPELRDCLMAAIVDANTGPVYRSPSPDRGMPYFGVFSETKTHHPTFSFHHTRLQSPFEYRVNSRLLIAHICEGLEQSKGPFKIELSRSRWIPDPDIADLEPRGCGPDFYVMDRNGLSLIGRYVNDHR